MDIHLKLKTNLGAIEGARPHHVSLQSEAKTIEIRHLAMIELIKGSRMGPAHQTSSSCFQVKFYL